MSVLHFKWQVFRKALRPMRKSGTVPDFYSRVLNRRNGSGNLGDGLKNVGKTFSVPGVGFVEFKAAPNQVQHFAVGKDARHFHT